jgi:hypothetical protein
MLGSKSRKGENKNCLDRSRRPPDGFRRLGVEATGPALSGWPVEALDQGNEPPAPGDEPGDGIHSLTNTMRRRRLVMILFKNLGGEFVEQFWSDGKVALRPLGYFATVEDERRDVLEGNRGIVIKAAEKMDLTTNEFWTAETFAIRSTVGRPVPIQISPGARVSTSEVMQKAYVFCVSEARVSKYGEAAYRIDEAERFKEILCAAMTRRGIAISHAEMRKVAYGGQRDPIGDFASAKKALSTLRAGLRIDDYFLKPSGYAEDREWRFVFLPESGEANENPLVIADKELLKVCSRV